MADPINYVVPTVGSSGFFELREPFNSKIDKNVRYTCQAVRRLSAFIADNEDVKKSIYDENKIAEDVYMEDLANDTQVASLQGETGQWLHVPIRFIIAYPNTNGIKYRTMAFSVGLPAMPVDKDMSAVHTAIANVVKELLGVNCVVENVETSKVTLVSSEKHNAKQIERAMVTGIPTTDRGLYMRTLRQLEDANGQIAALEAFIIANFQVPEVTQDEPQ